jgi:hypothetical protein
MADLEQSLATLKEAAKGRQVSRADLDTATEWLAGQIVGPLRSGDSVTIYRILAHGDALDGAGRGGRWTASQPDDTQVLVETVTVSVERVTWEVPFVENKGRRTHEHGANALVVESAVITDPRDDKTYHRVGRHSTLFGPAPALWDLHLASGDDRLRFCAMAPAIVEAFRRLAETQAEEYAKGADAVSKTVVR